MGRSLIAVGIASGFALLHVGCGGGTLSGGRAGTSGGSAGAAGSVVLTGMGGGVAPTGAGGDASTPCVQPMPAAPLPPNFLIALDTSATMNSLACATGCGSASRWQIAVDAINATTSVTEHLANWGLELFADGTNACGAIDAVGVPFGTGAAQRIAAALASRTTFGGDLANPSYRPTRNVVATATGIPGRADHRQPQLCRAGDHRGAGLRRRGERPAHRRFHGDGAGDNERLQLGFPDVRRRARDHGRTRAGEPGRHGGRWRAASSARPAIRVMRCVTSSSDLQAVLRSLVSDNEGCTFAVPPPPNDLHAPRLDQSSASAASRSRAIRGMSKAGTTSTPRSRPSSSTERACDVVKVDRTQPPAITFPLSFVLMMNLRLIASCSRWPPAAAGPPASRTGTATLSPRDAVGHPGRRRARHEQRGDDSGPAGGAGQLRRVV